MSGDGRGWVDVNKVPVFALNGSSYIAISPLRDGAAGHYRHLFHNDISKKRIVPLTHGRYEVNKIVHWDQMNNFVYFLGTPERYPGHQHLYRVSALPPKLGVSLKTPRCLTCATVQHGQAFLEPDVVTTSRPPRLVTSWDDDWEDDDAQPPTMPPPTQPPSTKRKRKKGKIIVISCRTFIVAFIP